MHGQVAASRKNRVVRRADQPAGEHRAADTIMEGRPFFDRETLRQVANKRIGIVLLLGFSSGLPLALTSGTLQAWMTVEGIDLTTIGIFTLASLPYTWKFLWAPFMDRYVPPLFGRRRGWMLLTQLGLVAAIAAMAMTSPSEATWRMAFLALLVVFLSASQDVAVDAFRTDALHARERGMGAAVFVGGYRAAMLVSGALALVLAQHLGWQFTYFLMAGLMVIGVMATLVADNPDLDAPPPASTWAAIRDPFREFFSRRGALALLLLIVLYKFGDAFAGTLTTAFLLRDVGFELQEIGFITKGAGLVASLLGVLFGGLLLARMGLYHSLMVFGILQALTNLGFWLLAVSGKSFALMALVIGMENIAGGMGTAAFVALLMALCNHRYSATQFALLSALAAVGRVYLGPLAGYLIDHQWVDWAGFFLLTTAAALPGLWLLWRMKPVVAGADVDGIEDL